MGSRTGIGNYTLNLCQALAIKKNSFAITICIHGRKIDLSNIPLELVSTSVLDRNLRKLLPYYKPAWLNKYDLFHETNYVPWLSKNSTVTTIYDMSYRLYPQYHPKKRVIKLKLYEQRMKNADRIITISQNSKNEIIDLLKVPEEKVVVTYLGYDGIYKPFQLSDTDHSELKKIYNLPESFFLYVGTVEPRKNLQRLIQAYNLYKTDNPSSARKLVIAGGRGWLDKEIYDSVNHLSLQNDVIFTGYVPDEHLPYLYNLALALVYPSLYEGFGLPPLEAMACGTPVITSNTSSLPEVVGDAALMVDPYNIEEMANAMTLISESEELRNEFSQQSLLQSLKFSWKRCAEETLKVYESCFSS